MQIVIAKFKGMEHVAFWLFIWLFVFDYYFFDTNWSEALIGTSAEVLTYIVIVYLNLAVLIPYIFKKRQALHYIVSLIVVIAIYVMVLRMSGLENYFYDLQGWRNVFSMILNAVLVFEAMETGA